MLLIVLRVVIVVISFATIGLFLQWGYKNKTDRLYMYIVLGWLLNVAGFYLIRLLNFPVDIVFLNSWSLGITLYACIILFFIGLYLRRYGHR